MTRLVLSLLLPLSALLLGVGEPGLAVGLPLGVVVLGGVAGLWVDWKSVNAALAFLNNEGN